jgi:hypothetical protein
MKTKILFACILLFYCLSPSLRAQDTEFWFVAPHMSEQSAAGIPLDRPAFLAISNATQQSAHVTITRYNGANASIVTPATILPGTLYKLDFTSDADMKTIENPRGQAGSVTEFGMHITSDVQVTACYVHNHPDSKDIFTLKGHQALGTLFYVPMQSDNAAPTNTAIVGACDQIDIVATEDNTEVTVIPKAAVHIAPLGSAPANQALPTYMLNKGQTLKIMELTPNTGSLTGTKITSTKPIAVTVTEDLTVGNGSNTSGDQIVPVGSLGTRYIVPRGYNTAFTERFYLVATDAGTTNVKVYYSGSNYNLITLNGAGSAARYDFPSSIYALYVEADHPVYLYHRAGAVTQEGAALLPSVYAIGQTQRSYYQVPGSSQNGFLVFRTGQDGGFRISYGSTNAALSVGTPIAVPNQPDWQVARFGLPSGANSQAVTIRNELGPFSLGYIAGSSTMGCYGYFSAYGTFEFPAITYMCGSSVVIHGGYAMSYLWTFPDGSTATTSSITATQEGVYTLVMNQDPNIVTATTTVQKVNAGVISPGEQVICFGDTPAPLTVTGASELTGTQYQWQISPDNVNWTNIGATSSTYQPGALTQTTWYRRGMTSDLCAMAYTYGMKVRISSCTLPVNPHLMGRFRGD